MQRVCGGWGTGWGQRTDAIFIMLIEIPQVTGLLSAVRWGRSLQKQKQNKVYSPRSAVIVRNPFCFFIGFIYVLH